MRLKRASSQLLIALIFASFVPPGGVLAQASSSQQSTILSPRAEQPKEKSEEKEKPAPPQQKVEPVPQTVIVPPAPVIIKRDPDSISIPQIVDTNQPPAGAPEQPKYEERPVTTTAKVGSLYGYRRDPFTGRARFHSGVDIKARWGDPIGASHQGTVQFAGWYHGYGNLIIVNHGGGVTTHYAHLSSYAVAVGERVERGTVVGYAGSTGRATSPHLHYEVRIDDRPVNPFQPVALDPSSSYFNQLRPTAEAVGEQALPLILIKPPLN